MPRRYTNMESKLVGDLQPGDEVLFRHRIEQVLRTAKNITVTWDDDTESTWPLEGDSAVEVVATKEKGE